MVSKNLHVTVFSQRVTILSSISGCKDSDRTQGGFKCPQSSAWNLEIQVFVDHDKLPVSGQRLQIAHSRRRLQTDTQVPPF